MWHRNNILISFILILSILLVLILPSTVFALESTSAPLVDFTNSLSKGIGFNYAYASASSSASIDLRLYDNLSPFIATGQAVSFFPDKDRMINYLVDDNKVKEEIVLFKKPASNKFYFSFVHEGLSPVKQAGGYALQNQQGETVFFLPPPTVADAGGKSGAVSLEINGDTAILNVEQNFLDSAAYPVVIDPTVIGTWQLSGLNNQRVVDIAFSPNYSADHIALAATDGGGVYKTTDGGASWQPANSGISNLYLKSVAISPNYASDQTIFVGTLYDGIYRSTNGGVSWSRVAGGFYTPDAYSLAFSPNYQTDHTVFAGIYGYFGGIYKSTDGGTSWTRVYSRMYFNIPTIAVSSNYAADKTVFFGSTGGLFKSTDEGASWTKKAPADIYNVRVKDIALSPDYGSDQTLLIATQSEGIYKSTDGGMSFTNKRNGFASLHTSAVALSPDFSSSGVAFAGIGDSYLGGIYQSLDGGENWQLVNDGLGSDYIYKLAASPDFDLDGTLLVGTAAGAYIVRDDQAPTSSIISPTGSATITASSLIVSGTAEDNWAVSRVDLAIRQDTNGNYWNSAASTWTASSTWNETSITAGLDSASAAWSYNWDNIPTDNGGSYTIEARAADGAGNVEATPASVSVVVNNAIPSGSIAINNGDQFTKDTTITIQNNINDAMLMRYSIDGTTWSDWENFATTKTLALPTGDDTKTIEAQFKKYQDSTNVFDTSAAITLDTQAPVTGITSPAANNQVSGTVTISAIAEDALSGTDKVQFFANDRLIGETTSSPYQVSWDTSNEINGPSILHIKAIDRLGNTSLSSPVEVEVNNPIPFTAATGIKNWLFMGPINSVSDTTPLSTDYLSGENIIKPSEDTTSLGKTWTPYDSSTETIDLQSFTGNATDVVTYANTYIYSPVDNAAQLRFGSDDGIKIWVNGFAVFHKDSARSFTMDEDTATIGLNAGWNQILVKIAHSSSAGNRFNLKIADSDGGETPGLTYQLSDPFPTIFFEDNFNQESSIPASRWETSDTVNSRVTLSHLESSTWFMTKDPMATADYRYALDAIFNPNSESTISAALMFRSIDSNNGYGLALSNEGVNFFKKVSGSGSQIGPSVPFKLDPGKKYHIQIEARGNTFTAAIDNVSLLRVTDSDNTFAAPGKIGVYQDGLISFYDNVKVTAPAPAPFVIKGTVTNQGPTSVPGVDIEASTYPDSNANVEEFASLTASDGSYYLEIPADTDTLPLLLSANSATYSNKQIENVTVSQANPEQAVNLNLADTGVLIGRVVDSSGTPINNVTVSAFSPDFLNGGESTITNSSFVLRGLNAPGDYHVVADAFGYSSKVVETTFSVSPDTTVTIPDITLIPAGKIAGSVVDAYGNPLAGVTVSARQPDDDQTDRATTTTADGSYLIEDLDVPGVYEVGVFKDGYEQKATSDISVASDQITPDINFVLGLQAAYKTNTNKLYGFTPGTDTHQWLTRKAISILVNDFGGGTRFNRFLNNINPVTDRSYWYTIATGTKWADWKWVQNQGYSKDHFHKPHNHSGMWQWSTSAANYAQSEFNEALTKWRNGDEESAMYLLGLALHHVQDLRVPQHAVPSLDLFDGHHAYETWVNNNKNYIAPPGPGGIYSFRKHGIHQDKRTAYGWVDQSAHVSIKYRYYAKQSDENNRRKTIPLIQSAQRFSAGFIKFFFKQVDWPADDGNMILPTTTLITTPGGPDSAGGYFSATPTITLTSDRQSVVYYRWDIIGAWNVYQGSFKAPEGIHTLHYYSVDTLGNKETVNSQAFKVKTDNITPPPPSQNNGLINIADWGNSRILVYKSDGAFVTSWDMPGSPDYTQGWNAVNNMAVNPTNNNIYSIGYIGFIRAVINITSPGGSLVATWGSDGNPLMRLGQGIAIDSRGYVYASGLSNDETSFLQKFDADGNLIENYANGDGSNGRLLYGSDVAIDSHDNVYVINYGYNWTTYQDESQILKFGPSGNFITTLGSLGAGDGQFNDPVGLGIDSADHVFVVDDVLDRVQEFDSNGNFITKWGSYGSGDGQFDWPSDIAVDSNNHKYVTDGNNNRVEVFDANNDFLYSFGDNQLYSPWGIVIGR